MPFAVGENVGAYRILEQLGQGGMATVYKAYHAALDRYVALKVLHPAFHEDKTFTARFQREARVVAKLEHPSIVPVYDYAEHESRPYLVMKYIEGETLKSRLAQGPLDTGEINRVVEAVGLALAYAHKQGILHRDIKPSNVLIATDGQMYLADFGLARIAQAGESTLSTDSIMGTPQYISPEQARGDKDLDAGTDIYSFGVMLYEMVVGQVPFSADTPFSIIHDHIYTPLPLPRVVNPDVPESVERVLLKALAKDRNDRYADVAAMVTAFKEALSTTGIPMQGPGLTLPAVTAKQGEESETVRAAEIGKPPAEPGKKAPKKKRSPWLFVAAGVLLTLCCLFVFIATRDDRQNLLPGKQPTSTRQVVDTPPKKEPTPPKPEPGEMPPAVQEAQRKVDENPEDPVAHLELALAFWDANMPRSAYETLNHAAELARGDRGFLIEAGNRFHERQAWIASATMYFRFIKQAGPDGEVPEEVRNNFHEAVYKAAPQPELEITLPFVEEVLKLDEPIGLVAQSRFSYYNGRPEDAWAYLNQVKRLKPGFFEASLLEGEYMVNEKRYEEANAILQPLTADPAAPEWIRVMAKDLLGRIP
ncbi:MAG: protein kinase domain-containing protein [Chloroflexota bacterium]